MRFDSRICYVWNLKKKNSNRGFPPIFHALTAGLPWFEPGNIHPHSAPSTAGVHRTISTQSAKRTKRLTTNKQQSTSFVDTEKVESNRGRTSRCVPIVAVPQREEAFECADTSAGVLLAVYRCLLCTVRRFCFRRGQIKSVTPLSSFQLQSGEWGEYTVAKREAFKNHRISVLLRAFYMLDRSKVDQHPANCHEPAHQNG